MKNFLVIGIIAVLAIAGYFIGSNLNNDEKQQKNTQTGEGRGERVGREGRNANPELRVRGRVMSISDSEIIVGTFEQQQRGGGDRAQFENLSDQERQALRAQRQAEREAQGEPEITGEKVIELTEETIFEKARGGFGRGGDGNREQGRDNQERPEPELVSRSEVAEGNTVNIILKKDTAQAERVMMVQQQQ